MISRQCQSGAYVTNYSRGYGNERDIEVPRLLEYARARRDTIRKVLDVGCHSATYIQELWALDLERLDGVDLLPCAEGEEDDFTCYYTKNVRDIQLRGYYDFVIAVSTIEHAGIMPGYAAEDWEREQLLVFERILDLSQRYVFVTIPFGQPAYYPPHFANMTYDRLSVFCTALTRRGFKGSVDFWHNPTPRDPDEWCLLSPSAAAEIEYDPAKGVQCVCILTAERIEKYWDIAPIIRTPWLNRL